MDLQDNSISYTKVDASNIPISHYLNYPYSSNYSNTNIMKTNYLIIDSGDRDWYAQIDETPINFSIKLGNQSIGNHNCHIKDIFKNVMKIHIDKLIMPNRIIATSYNSNTSIRLNDNAYLNVQFDGINDINLGTNTIVDQSIAIMTPLIPLPKEQSNISYLEFKNVNNQSKIYYGSPKASIDRLDTNIYTATGEKPHQFADVLIIDRAFSSYSNIYIPLPNTSITLRTTSFFNNEYSPSDLIKIQGYTFHNTTNNECFIMNNYINRQQGHRIISISSNITSNLYNEIQIPIPQYYNTITGQLTYESWYIDFLTKNNFNDIISDSGGKLINTNLQTRLMVNITNIL